METPTPALSQQSLPRLEWGQSSIRSWQDVLRDLTGQKGVHVEVEVHRPLHVFGTCLWHKHKCALFPKFVKETSDVLRRVKAIEATTFLGDFNARFGNNAGVWKGVGQHAGVDMKENELCIVKRKQKLAQAHP